MAMADNGANPRGPRCIALVGPFQSGKTTLLEALLARTNAIQRQGTVEAGTTVGDASKEAGHHKMSAALPAVDAAVVGCEADERKVSQLQLLLREVEDLKIPRCLFLNK